MPTIPLGVYRHYKGNLYELVGFAKHSETLDDMVIYNPLYGERGTWVRPLSMWEEYVQVDGKEVKRFELIEEKNGSINDFTLEELSEAHGALLSTLRKCEKIDSTKLAPSQQTLLERRGMALNIALALIEREVEWNNLTQKLV